MTQAIYTKSTAREYFESLVITVILALFGTTFIVQAFKIPTESMEDNLLVGDHLLVNKFAFGGRGSIVDAILPFRDVHRGDVIVFKYPKDLSKNFVKRAIGVPGDHFKMVDRQIYINGQPLNEPYKIHKNPRGVFPDPRDTFPPKLDLPVFEGDDPYWWKAFKQGDEIVVPNGDYFAMGDNRDNSLDSRYWGFVPRDLIVGKALVIYWSYETNPPVQSNGSPQGISGFVSTLFHSTRWSRTLRLIR